MAELSPAAKRTTVKRISRPMNVRMQFGAHLRSHERSNMIRAQHTMIRSLSTEELPCMMGCLVVLLTSG